MTEVECNLRRIFQSFLICSCVSCRERFVAFFREIPDSLRSASSKDRKAVLDKPDESVSTRGQLKLNPFWVNVTEQRI